MEIDNDYSVAVKIIKTAILHNQYEAVEIQIKLGHTKARKAILKAGAKVSVDVSDSFSRSASIKAHRKQLEPQGKLINRILQEDITFESQSGAGQFLNGISFDGNSNWKTIKDDTPLKNLLA